MEGYKLQNGTLLDRPVSDTELWQVILRLFSETSRKTMSYKFGLLRSMLYTLESVDSGLTVTFEELFEPFASLYWDMVVCHGLSQVGRRSGHESSAVERVLLDTASHLSLPEGTSFDALGPDVRRRVVSQVRHEGKRYVVGALYGDTAGALYAFDMSKEVLQFHPDGYRFMKSYRPLLMRLANIELLSFLKDVTPPDRYRSLLFIV
jgi:hypothetical protein